MSDPTPEAIDTHELNQLFTDLAQQPSAVWKDATDVVLAAILSRDREALVFIEHRLETPAKTVNTNGWPQARTLHYLAKSALALMTEDSPA